MKQISEVRNRNSVWAAAVLSAAMLLGIQQTARAVTTGWNQTGAGPFDYTNTANWVGGTINGIWDVSLTNTAAQTATFSADTVLGTGLTFNYAGAFNLTLRSDGVTNRLLTLGGDVAVNPVANQTVTLGSSTANQGLNVNLGGVTRTLTVNVGKALTFANVITNGGLTVTGGGTVNPQGNANTFTGVLTITGGATVSSSTSGAMLGGSPSAIGAASNAAANIVIDNGTLVFGSLNPYTDHLFTIGLGGAMIGGYQGSYNNAGALAFTGTGSRILRLYNTYSVFNFYPQIGDAAAWQPTMLVLPSANTVRTTLANTSPNTYSGGTIVSNGVLAASGNIQSLGASNVVVCAGAVLQLSNITNVNASGGAKVLLNGTPNSPATLAVAWDATQAQLNTLLDNRSTNAVLSLFSDVTSHTTVNALDLGSLGNGYVWLGISGYSTFGGDTTIYSASTLGVGAGNTYRLGGAAWNRGANTLDFTHDVLANVTGGISNSLVLGSTVPNINIIRFETGNSGFLGPVALNNGTLSLYGSSGAFASDVITAFCGSAVSFDCTNNVTGTTRAKGVVLKNASLAVTGNAGASDVETITDALTLDASASPYAYGNLDIVTLTPNAAKNTQLTASRLVRTNNAAALFRGMSLGVNSIGSATANSANIWFATPPTGMLVGGGGVAGTHDISIFPWAVGSITAAGAGDNFVTYDSSNGVRPLTAGEYDTAITDGVVTNSNVSLTTGTTTINTNATVNSLFLSGSAVVSGTGTLTIASGALFMRGQKTHNVNLNFGAAEGVIGTDGGNLNSLQGTINGSGGVTYYINGAGAVGNGAQVASVGNYTGNTTVIGNSLMLWGANVIPYGPGKGDVYVHGCLYINTSSGVAMNGLWGSGLVYENLGAGTFPVTIGYGDASSTFDGKIAHGAANNPLGLTKVGLGTLTLTGPSTYQGPTAIQNGTIRVASINSTNNGSASSNLGTPSTVNGAIALGATSTTGQLTYVGAGETTDRPINLAGTTGGGVLDASGTGPLVFSSAFTATGAGSKTLTLQGTSTNANAILGAITNNSAANLTSLAKNGSGLWILAGTNTFTGTTLVNTGTLAINGSIVSPVTVMSNAVLAGTGRITTNTTAVTVNASGIVAPGLTGLPGTLTVTGNVSFANNSIFRVVTSSSNASLLAVSGNVTGSGTVLVDVATTNAGPWLIMTAANIAPTFTTTASGWSLVKRNSSTELWLMHPGGTTIFVR